MRKQICMIGKRLAAGLLGAAMLFTAVGVVGPVEVKAANDVSITIKHPFSYSNAQGTSWEFENNSWPELSDVTAGTVINARFNLTNEVYINSETSTQISLYPTSNNVGITVSGAGWSGSGNRYSATVQKGSSITARIEITTPPPKDGNYSFIRLAIGSTNPSGNHIARINHGSDPSGTTGGTGTISGGSTGSGTTTPGTTTGGTTPGTGTTTGSTTGGTGASTDTKPATGKTEPSIPVHTHSYNWETLHEPTEEHDGEMADICSVCGDIRQRVPITGFYLFQKETMDKVRAAAPNATVEVKTSKWISFHRMVMNALAERQDVTLKVSFLEGEYRGARKTLTIPAGTDTAALLNEDGYAGFKYLGGLFGLE